MRNIPGGIVEIDAGESVWCDHYEIFSTLPTGGVVVDRARLERLLALADAVAEELPGWREGEHAWTASETGFAFDALQAGDRDPLP
jgi:hypothetical protein